jgi:hypothetical protein
MDWPCAERPSLEPVLHVLGTRSKLIFGKLEGIPDLQSRKQGRFHCGPFHYQRTGEIEVAPPSSRNKDAFSNLEKGTARIDCPFERRWIKSLRENRCRVSASRSPYFFV